MSENKNVKATQWQVCFIVELEVGGSSLGNHDQNVRTQRQKFESTFPGISERNVPSKDQIEWT